MLRFTQSTEVGNMDASVMLSSNHDEEDVGNAHVLGVHYFADSALAFVMSAQPHRAGHLPQPAAGDAAWDHPQKWLQIQQ